MLATAKKVHRPGGIGRPRTRPDRVRADWGYTSAGNRARLRRRGIAATIPEKTDQQANRKAKVRLAGAHDATPEGGDDIDRSDRSDLIDLAETLDTDGNTFFIVYPVDDDLEWSFAVSKSISAFGGFELDRFDADNAEHDITTAADPETIADDILAWISRR